MKVEERIKAEREKLKKKTFSFTAFVELMTDYVNEPEFESHVMKMEDEQTAVEIKSYPVKHFRKILRSVLLEYGVAEKDADTVMTDYKFKKKDMEGMYEFITDFIYQYLRTGRRLQVFNKRDMNLSIIANDVEEFIKPYPGNEKRKDTTIRYKNHKKVSSKSSCPKWEKETLSEDQKNVLKSIKKIFKEEE